MINLKFHYQVIIYGTWKDKFFQYTVHLLKCSNNYWGNYCKIKIKINSFFFHFWMVQITTKNYIYHKMYALKYILYFVKNNLITDKNTHYLLQIEWKNINHFVFFQNMYKLWTGDNYNSHMTCFPFKSFKTVKHSSNWMEHVNDFFFDGTEICWGTVKHIPTTCSNCCVVRVTCMQLITDTSGCHLTDIWLCNANGQLGGTEQHY